jgi:acyl-coenzyme A thioesterase PaaI-like protein
MEAQPAIAAVLDVPFVRHSGIEILGAGSGWAIAGVDQRPDLTSHMGTFQGAALYAVAETAVSAVLASLAEENLDSVALMVSDATVNFTRPATERVTAHATLSEAPQRIYHRFVRDGGTALAVVVRLRDGAGNEVGRAEFSCRMMRRLPSAVAAATTIGHPVTVAS